jgi:hypothetical protein
LRIDRFDYLLLSAQVPVKGHLTPTKVSLRWARGLQPGGALDLWSRV